ncbi:hypothetical protein N182_35040 [Sinorhizobium sp. GL2]|nr:hypothetical protein N182_35040 [Sinorhizobium sp. GL2]
MRQACKLFIGGALCILPSVEIGPSPNRFAFHDDLGLVFNLQLGLVRSMFPLCQPGGLTGHRFDIETRQLGSDCILQTE